MVYLRHNEHYYSSSKVSGIHAYISDGRGWFRGDLCGYGEDARVGAGSCGDGSKVAYHR